MRKSTLTDYFYDVQYYKRSLHFLNLGMEVALLSVVIGHHQPLPLLPLLLPPQGFTSFLVLWVSQEHILVLLVDVREFVVGLVVEGLWTVFSGYPSGRAWLLVPLEGEGVYLLGQPVELISE